MPRISLTCPTCKARFHPEDTPVGHRQSCPGCGTAFLVAVPAPEPARWYHARDGKSEGPVPITRLREMAAAGALRPTDHVWSAQTGAWAEAGSVRGLFPSSDGAADEAVGVPRAFPAAEPVTVAVAPVAPGPAAVPAPCPGGMRLIALAYLLWVLTGFFSWWIFAGLGYLCMGLAGLGYLCMFVGMRRERRLAALWQQTDALAKTALADDPPWQPLDVLEKGIEEEARRRLDRLPVRPEATYLYLADRGSRQFALASGDAEVHFLTYRILKALRGLAIPGLEISAGLLRELLQYGHGSGSLAPARYYFVAAVLEGNQVTLFFRCHTLGKFLRIDWSYFIGYFWWRLDGWRLFRNFAVWPAACAAAGAVWPIGLAVGWRFVKMLFEWGNERIRRQFIHGEVGNAHTDKHHAEAKRFEAVFLTVLEATVTPAARPAPPPGEGRLPRDGTPAPAPGFRGDSLIEG